MTGKLEPAEIYHQVLEHRWFMSQDLGREVDSTEAVNSYITNVLAHRREEEALIEPTTGSITLPDAVPSGTIKVADEDGEVDWRDLV